MNTTPARPTASKSDPIWSRFTGSRPFGVKTQRTTSISATAHPRASNHFFVRDFARAPRLALLGIDLTFHYRRDIRGEAYGHRSDLQCFLTHECDISSLPLLEHFSF